MPSPFSDHFSTDPYWWNATPRPASSDCDLPNTADVLIIGSGYTGLHTALQCARAGRHTVVIDAECAGWGCSTRNGGQISTSLKHNYPALAKKYGEAKGREISLEGQRALLWIEQFVKAENIHCDFLVNGRFHAAHSQRAFNKIARSQDKLAPGLVDESKIIPRAEQHKHIGSDAYFGGIFYPNYASLDPAKYHAALLKRAQQAGVSLVDKCAANDIKEHNDGYTVQTVQGTLQAQQVVIASNGYTGALTPWQRRRVIPIGSYMIATEEIPEQLMRQLIPQNNIITDSRKVVYYYRASPDRKRLLFGGRVSHNETDPRVSGPALHRDLVELFPDLQQSKISHSWMGFVAYTFDELPHIGQHNGLHYAMGYCGAGVSLSSYFGMKLGRKISGLPDAHTGMDHLAVPTRPFYTGNPWFLAPSVRYYRWRDKHS